MDYGYFDDPNREYVITNPKTPVKWINYIGALQFGGFVDHTGGALLCKGDPASNRVTKYIQQMPAHEFRGETLYVRVKENGGYRVFSPFYTPTLDPFDRFECHVGLGYSRFVTEMYQIRAEIAVFVPRNAFCEIRDIRITNLAAEPREVDIVPLVEYTHPRALMQFTNADWVPQTMVSRLAEDNDGLKIVTQYAFMYRDTQINYFTSNAPASSFETDRKVFLGDNEYGTWARPLSLQKAELLNTQAHRGDTIAALLHHMGMVGSGETRTLITQLGRDESLDAARESIERFRDSSEVTGALRELAAFWEEYLGKQQVVTPDASMNHMVNVHNPRQCYVTKNWSRYLSFYQLGMGARGIGFRDSSQDVMGVLASAPAESRELISMLLSIQRPDGSAYHQMNPLTREASIGEAGEYGSGDVEYYGDDHLWIVLAVCEYLKETGDDAYLDRTIPFYANAVGTNGAEEGSVLEHLNRAIAFTAHNVGAHGLPLLGYADWNDCVNLQAGAESLFIANLYGAALQSMIELAEYRNDAAACARYRNWYDTMKARVNEHAWDGSWYVRYFDKDGKPLGSSANEVCRIYANGQSWPVISGFATPERARLALDSVNSLLNTENGVKIASPGYDGFDPEIGGISTYPPGAKENCGIFLHTNPWVIIAEAMLGNGDRAFKYYNQINPAAKNENADCYEVEPYVYAQNILADEHPQFGLGRNSWLSGTSSWTYQAATKYILGIRPAYAGLVIDPCIPRSWDGFSATRQFRGATYLITVSNPDRVSRGVKSFTVDGLSRNEAVAPIFDDGREHRVAVVMGNR